MNRRARRSALPKIFLTAICMLTVSAARSSANNASKHEGFSSKFSETVVAKTSGLVQTVQAANGHLAWTEQKGPCTVHRDGAQEGRKYDSIQYLEFSPSGEHLAFFAQNQSNWFLVLDGQPRSESFPNVMPLVFQPRGASWAFPACGTTNICQMIVDGRPEKIYEQLTSPVYSADGKKLAYLAEANGKWYAIINGAIIGPPMEDHASFGFSPDSSRFFVAGTEKKLGWTYFVDGVAGPGFVQLSPIVFSNDGKHYVYGGSEMQLGFKKNQTSGLIVADGKEGPLFHGSGLLGEWTLLLDASIATPELYFGSPLIGPLLRPLVLHPGASIFSPKLNGISDPVLDPLGNAAYAARRAAHDVIVMDGSQTGPSFDDVSSDVVFSSDGQHSAYVALRGLNFVQVVDSRPGKFVSLDPKAASKPAENPPPDPDTGDAPATPLNPDDFSVGWAVLAPHATHFGYEIVHGRTNFHRGRTQRAERTVVVDGAPGPQFNALSISPIEFTDDGQHYWYAVDGAKGSRSLVIIDGLESRLYDNITPPQYDDSSQQIVFFGRKGSRLVRVTFPLH